MALIQPNMRCKLFDPFLAIFLILEKFFQTTRSKEGVIFPGETWDNNFGDEASNVVVV